MRRLGEDARVPVSPPERTSREVAATDGPGRTSLEVALRGGRQCAARWIIAGGPFHCNARHPPTLLRWADRWIPAYLFRGSATVGRTERVSLES